MDYRTYHAINQFVHHHDWLGRTLSSVEMWFVPLFAIAQGAVMPRKLKIYQTPSDSSI